MKVYFIFDSYEIDEEPTLYEVCATKEQAEARLEQLNTIADVYHIEERELPTGVKAKLRGSGFMLTMRLPYE
jgi:hypothetical protein